MKAATNCPRGGVELNIRLDSKRGVNNQESFRQREQLALQLLGEYGKVSHRLRGFWPEHVRILVLLVEVDTIPTQALFELATVMLQDCISVFYPARREGALIGPLAAQWGAFDLDKFYRFDASLNTGIQEPKAIEKKPPVPVDEQTRQQQQTAMYDRIRQVFPQQVLDALAQQQRTLADNAINRVINRDGMEALTVERLEGIYELVTQHLWSPAFTAAAKTLQEAP